MKPPKLDDRQLLKYLLRKYKLDEATLAVEAGLFLGLDRAEAGEPTLREFSTTTPEGAPHHRKEIIWTTPTHTITATIHGRIIKIKPVKAAAKKPPKQANTTAGTTVVYKRSRKLNVSQ